MQEAEYPEVSELDFQLEKMALFMGCSRKVVKYQEQLWNSSDEYYWGWTEGGRWVDKNGFIINEEFYQGDSLLYHTDWNWLHPVISKVYHYSLRKEGYTRGQDVLIEQLKWFTFVGDIDKVFELCITLIDFINTKTQ